MYKLVDCLVSIFCYEILYFTEKLKNVCVMMVTMVMPLRSIGPYVLHLLLSKSGHYGIIFMKTMSL